MNQGAEGNMPSKSRQCRKLVLADEREAKLSEEAKGPGAPGIGRVKLQQAPDDREDNPRQGRGVGMKGSRTRRKAG